MLLCQKFSIFYLYGDRYAGNEHIEWWMVHQVFFRCLKTWLLKTISITVLRNPHSLRGECAFVPFRWPTKAFTSALCWPIKTAELPTTGSSMLCVCSSFSYLGSCEILNYAVIFSARNQIVWSQYDGYIAVSKHSWNIWVCSIKSPLWQCKLKLMTYVHHLL